ncbi:MULTISPECIES: tRNA lysidine(34) synthetase TilS [unclassified Polynucleobacter]|uniref:tRNA lysidine(34) synthetase TilS n=1 Tax=unclassified Polynucleobacter TaxID=2640945 RepID=UPI000BC42433|nr:MULTISPECIES: tRNA lysidine(34) synthetase TilS [unclassified Polynucleobacter]OYY21003.1 MAG: tRNA lysidine(34) synthetase TilS [Polynucleobacter sp. 35-46-11]OZA77742.1 MAG: tRNA lysidine(34) synthetase TilS [Polynucleobacter sp. 39-46-10]
MASSRKSKPSPKAASQVATKATRRIGLALSGGLDSVVLLDTVCKAVHANSNNPTEVWVFHIHHGLQRPADQWLEFCERLAKKYQVHFDFRLLHFADQSQGNIEARARVERYEALTDLCVEHGIEDLLLAHHQNDQAETVLLQLLRGSGVAGLSGMPLHRANANQVNPITFWRPLLSQSRAELEVYAKEHKLKWVEDPSNQNTRYRRNAIRKNIIPRLEKIQPGAIANLARSADLLAHSQVLLDRLAELDGKKILQANQLKLAQLLTLANTDKPAANNLMRHWLRLNDLAMPSQERLESWWKDLMSVKAGSSLEWQHDGVSIHLWRDRLQVVYSNTGRWIFQAIPARSKSLGLPADWVNAALEKGLVEERVRQGAEKIQVKPNTPRKTLKNLFQESDTPPWERQAPLLYINDQLVAVAGVGVSYSHLVAYGKRVLPCWELL